MQLVILTASSRTFLSETGIFLDDERVATESTAAPVQLGTFTLVHAEVLAVSATTTLHCNCRRLHSLKYK